MTTTSINFHLRPSVRPGRHTGKLFIRIIRARQTRQISTDYALYKDEWDTQRKIILFPPADTAAGHVRNQQLSLIEESVAGDLKHLREVVALLDSEGDYSADDVVRRFASFHDRNTLCGYAEFAAAKLREQGQERTARAYRSAVKSLSNFNGGKEILLSEINAALLRAYEQSLIDKGLKLNTVSFYLRNLRAIYFRAAAEKLILRQVNPFAGMHTGVYETKRRSLDGDQLKALAELEELLCKKLTEAKSKEKNVGTNGPKKGRWAIEEELRKITALYDSLLYFLFCYHARGMSYVDMAYLRKQDVGKEVFIYRRRKTGGTLEVKVTKPMRDILAWFEGRTKGSTYAFPIIVPSGGNARRQYETGLKRQNSMLKLLKEMAGITENLSTHVARHTWATLAKRLNVPVEVIGEALGHRDVKTTSIYLASFDRETMDELSVKMSKAIKAA